MITQFLVFSRNGYVLWQKDNDVVLRGSPVETFIKNVLLESRTSLSSYTTETYTLKWTFENSTKPGLVFLCICAKTLVLPWVDDLLHRVKAKFVRQYEGAINSPETFPLSFDFDTVMGKAMKQNTSISMEQAKDDPPSPVVNKEDGPASDTPASDTPALPKQPTSPLRRKASVRIKRAGPGGFKKKDKLKKDEKKKRPGMKKQPSWKEGKFSEEAAAGLDMTKEGEPAEHDEAYQRRVQEMKERMEGGENDDNWQEGYDDDDDDDEAPKTGLFGSFMNLIGNRTLKEEDLTKILTDMKEHLVQKNVGHDVSNDLTESVRMALVGKKLGTFSQVKTLVREAFEAELSRILTPKKSIDIIHDIRASKAAGKPYSIVFIGVNGVGKSTSLSKICYYLLSQRFRVLIAACDTFRSGAVEQLKVHSDCLGVPVFDKGYKRDPAHVAKEAIQYATENNFDVVLVDTAGRMQNNQPLMIALSKIITMNSPELILFVGEAIVGNDALDQLTEFNRALADNATGKDPRLIDGIVLTKFDCVDDKVGTAVSMVHRTGQPIMFVGTGQKYTHLRRLNVPTVVNSLLK